MPTLKEIRQRLRDLRARTGNAVVEMGGNEPPEGEPTDGALYHIDQAVEGLTAHIEAGYNSPEDLGSGPTEDDTSDSSDGHDTSDDTTTDPEPEPSTGDPDSFFDPDQYGSQQELEDDPYGVFSDVEIGGRYFLDTEVARPGGSQSMRFDYVDQGATEQGVGRRMPLSERVREVWIEFEIRWSENFFANAVLDDTKTTFSHKLLFAQAQATATSPNWETSDGEKVSRWPLLWPMGGSATPPNASIGIASPRRVDGNAGTADPLGRIGVNAADYFDAQWHTVRMHLRHDPGLYWLEVDGEVLADVDGFTIHPEVAIPAILVGRNKVTGNASGTESLWWGTIKAWIEDPGW